MTVSAKDKDRMLTEIAANLTRCMDNANVDASALADLSGIPESRIASILAVTVEVNATEILMFSQALDVRPSDLVPALTSA